MPRIRLEVSPKVQQLARLYRQLRASERNALRRANDIGRLLRGLPFEEREAARRHVGLKLRLAQLYIRIADHWEEVKVACSSIRQADVFLRRPTPRAGPFLFPWADSWPELYEASRIPPILEYQGCDGKRHSAVPNWKWPLVSFKLIRSRPSGRATLSEASKMRHYISVAERFFVVGVMVAVAWLIALTVTLGGAPVLPMRISFPGMFIHWPGLPWQGVTGGMIWLMFLVTTATNGVIYALIAVGILGLMKCIFGDAMTRNSN